MIGVCIQLSFEDQSDTITLLCNFFIKMSHCHTDIKLSIKLGGDLMGVDKLLLDSKVVPFFDEGEKAVCLMAATQSHLLVNISHCLSSGRLFISLLYTLMLGKIYILLLSSSLLIVYSHFIRGCF
ncbi:unnamed protein product [Brassica oleracea]